MSAAFRHSEEATEKELRQKTAELSAIFRSLSLCLLVAGKDRKIRTVNAACETLFGYCSEELIGKETEMLYANKADYIKQGQIRFHPNAKENTKSYEMRYRRKDGSIFIGETIGNMIRNRNGDFLGFLGSIRDISQHKEDERKVLRYERILSSVNDMVAMLDRRYIYLAANAAYSKAFGIEPDAVIGRTVTEILGEKTFNQTIKASADRCLAGEEIRYQHWLEFPVGGRKFMDIAYSPYREADNKIQGFTVVARDITPLKQAEEEKAKFEAHLRQNQKLEAIGTLAGGVAHEINNPITGIMSYAQLIHDRLAPDDPLREFAGEITKESERVAEIVRNLLSFARQEKESHSLANISDILNNTLTLIRTIIRRDQITLDVDVAGGLPMLMCRSQQIQQVLMNLFTNARDAINARYPGYDQNKVMTVIIRPFIKEGRQWIRTTVEDHGIGIPNKIQEHLFDPFFTTKDRSLGTGLGLSISHGIVRDHHGKLTFESEEGRYTRFHLDLPAETNADFGARNAEEKTKIQKKETRASGNEFG